jgi:hypothetical protein
MEAHARRRQERRLPPIQQIAVAVLVLIVIGGIYTAAHLPRHVPQGPTIALLCAAVVLLAVNVGLLARIEDFAWHVFRLVSGWVLPRLPRDRRHARVRLRLRPHARLAAADPHA